MYITEWCRFGMDPDMFGGSVRLIRFLEVKCFSESCVDALSTFMHVSFGSLLHTRLISLRRVEGLNIFIKLHFGFYFLILYYKYI